ncbi:MAG TPA: Gfo/Idh/MocA family oxidoreductase [Vicinamibacteria bacterium]|nr:Gfo/Idh/MocA family oxidoreductase [Vicinamibacteria bacterium]
MRSRRDFLKRASAGALAALASRRLAADEASAGCAKPADGAARVGLATIGIGGQGTGDTKAALKVPGVELVAVADVYDGRLTRAREVFCEGLVTTRDYRDLLARPDVDAVIIATPDHWHATMAIEALQAGKHVYVEKPMVHSLAEGLKLVEAEQRAGRVCQVGSQRVSSLVYHKAKALLAGGSIGELNLVQAWWNRNSPIGAWQYTIPPDASPQTVDWERFLGPAPRRPFDATRLFRWRNYDDYGTGVAGDLFVHLFSGLHLVTGALGPTRIMATGGLRHWKDGRDAADVMLGLFEYPRTARHPEFTLSLQVNFADGAGESEGFRFVGAEGVMSVSRDGVTLSRHTQDPEPEYTIETFPKAMQDAFLKEHRAKHPELKRELPSTREEQFEPPRGYRDLDHHLANFVEAVRARTPAFEDAAFGLRAAGPALLCNQSQREKRPITWDPEAMRAV